ncbi:uncharacterized protein LOC143180429 [Calliopsis andreniformis]|uniref:uncharacterized protein LOC143180429 n=1 Tax=Calliopsis andreniformis TaxID=337506 RepID=UPI003FCD70A3
MESVILYGCPIWATAIQDRENAMLLRRAQGIGLNRVVRAYRTVFLDALRVLADILPLLLKIREMEKLYKAFTKIRKRNIRTGRISYADDDGGVLDEDNGYDVYPAPWIVDNVESRDEQNQEREHSENQIKQKKKQKVRAEMLNRWQINWDRSSAGRWTYCWIKNVSTWVERRYGLLDFYLTQALTGHGCFREYLRKIGKELVGHCWNGCEEIDDAEPTFMRCQRRKEPRIKLRNILEIDEKQMTPERLGVLIFKDAKNWLPYAKYCTEVLKQTEKDERDREKVRPTSIRTEIEESGNDLYEAIMEEVRD